MSSFVAAIDFVLKNEGGYVNHANDPGGATNFGVSLRALRALEGGNLADWDKDGDGDIDAADMQLLTRKDAIQFYKKHFWNDHYKDINVQLVATKVFDMAVNVGQRQAGRILQRAINWDGPVVHVDGIIGPATVRAVNSLGPRLRKQLPAELAAFYFLLVDQKPARGTFLLGWLRRAYHMPAQP